MSQTVYLSAIIPAEHHGKRLDQVLAVLFPEHSRSRLQTWIKAGLVRMSDEVATAKTKAVAEAQVIIETAIQPEADWRPEEMDLAIVHQDEAIIVINKPAGLVVHPAAGNPAGTLVNALLHHFPELAYLPRAGIIHRLDKDTTGLLVVARTLTAHTHLVAALQARLIKREYEAVVIGRMIAGGTVNAPVGRHPHHRTRMAVTSTGKPAVTHYRILERYKNHTRLSVQLETGRTHQIRVHMAHIHYPLWGDAVYAGRMAIPTDCTLGLRQQLLKFKRQALHAIRLGLTHPLSGEWQEWQIPLPQDMQQLIDALQQDCE